MCVVLLFLALLFPASGFLFLGQSTTFENPTTFGDSTFTTRLTLRPDVGTYTEPQMTQARNIIVERLEALEVSGSRVYGDMRIITVELPPVDDLNVVIATITESGLLEFVDFSGVDVPAEWVGRKINTTRREYGDGVNHPLTVEPFETVITGADLQTVTPSLDSITNSWVINFEVEPQGAEKLGAFTESHIGEAMAIVLNGEVISVPIIQARIDTAVLLTGNFSEAEARKLAFQLEAGALPFPLVIETIQSIE